MKKLFLIFLIVSLWLFLQGQTQIPISQAKMVNENKQKLDSTIAYNEFGLPFAYVFYSYDDQGNVIESVIIFVSMNSKERTQYSYAATGEIISNVIHSWDEVSGQWMPEEKTEYSYDNMKLLILKLYSVWDEDSSAWIEDTKKTYLYDGEEKLIEIIEYEWIQGNNDWAEDRKEEYFYYPNGIMDYQIDYEKWPGQWHQMWKHDYSYDNEERLILECELEWEGALGIWDSITKYEYTYDNYGNLSMYITFEWDDAGNIWMNYDKTEYLYNNNYSFEDLVLPILFEGWYVGFNNNMLIEANYSRWDASSSLWNFLYVSKYYYSDYIPGYLNEPNLFHLVIFPNPASMELNISAEGFTIYEVSIYTITGQQVIRTRLKAGSIDISTLQPGMYIVEVLVENRKFRQKMVKLMQR